MPEMSFGRSIRFRRNKLGLSQNRLGELVGRSGAAVRSWERDSSTPTDPSVLQALSAVLGIEREVIFEKAGVALPAVETSPTVEEVLGSLTPSQSEMREEMPSPVLTEIEEVEDEDGQGSEDDEYVDLRVYEEDEVGDDMGADEGTEGAGEDVITDVSGEQPVFSSDAAAPKAAEPVAVAAVPGAYRSTAASDPTRPSFSSNPPRFLMTTPAPPLPEPTYMEDESQRQLYRIRNLATLVLIVGLIVLFVWALGNGWENFSAWWDDFLSYLQL